MAEEKKRGAHVVVTITINPESPEIDLTALEATAKQEITNFGGDVGKIEQEPIGFGLKAIKLIFIMDESKGSPDELEQKLAKLAGVASARVTDVRRTIG
jgi:elongation factor 1-beta